MPKQPRCKICFPTLSLFCLATFATLAAATGSSDKFDFRHPRPPDNPSEHVSGPTELRFLPLSRYVDFLYDLDAQFGADEVEPFQVQRVLVNGQPVRRFAVFNGSVVNLLNRANGIEDLTLRFYAGWQPGQQVAVTISGVRPNGDPFTLTLTRKAPDTNYSANSLSFNYPEPEFPYFHLRGSFHPANYDSFQVESIAVNGDPVREYRIFKDGFVMPGAEDESGGESYDGDVPGGVGFSVVLPYRWRAGEEISVTVSGKTPSGEAVELTASGRPGWNGFWRADWLYYASIVVHETAGIPRHGEPVEVTLGLMHYRLTDPEREIRVVTRMPGHPNADQAGFVEVPSQIIETTTWNDRSLIEADERDVETGERIRRYIGTTTVQLVFLADVEAYENRVFLVCYGNRRANSPSYQTDLVVEGEGLGQRVSNSRYRVGLAANSGAIETVVVKGGGPEVLLEHKLETNGAVHWNPGVYAPPKPWVHASDWENPPATFHTGPVMHRVSKYANLPYMENVAAHVTYRFFAQQPYVLVSTTMRVMEDIFVQALRNGEIVFNHAVLDEFVWKDPLGKVQSLKIAGSRRHPKHALEIPPDTPWMAFISRKEGVGFAGIVVSYENANLYGQPISQAQPYFYVQNGPWIYWSRGLVYPFGGSNFTRMMPVRKGSIYLETNAYLPFRLASGSNPFAEIEKYRTILTHPLKTTEWIDLDPQTPRKWIMPLLTAPFDEGVKDAQTSREVRGK